MRSWADLDDAPKTVAGAYLRFHILSHRLALPNTVNLDGVFSRLSTSARAVGGAAAPGPAGAGPAGPTDATSLTVSVTARAGTTASCPARTAATTRRTVSGGVSARAASCTRTTAARGQASRIFIIDDGHNMSISELEEKYKFYGDNHEGIDILK